MTRGHPRRVYRHPGTSAFQAGVGSECARSGGGRRQEPSLVVDDRVIREQTGYLPRPAPVRLAPGALHTLGVGQLVGPSTPSGLEDDLAGARAFGHDPVSQRRLAEGQDAVHEDAVAALRRGPQRDREIVWHDLAG